MSGICYQINLQHHFGGGEVYTRFFSEALIKLGWEVVLFVHPKAGFWHSLLPSGVRTVAIHSPQDLLDHLPAKPSLFVAHAPVTGKLAETLAKHHILTGIVHMPLYGRDASPFRAYHAVFPVSRHVRDSLLAAGIQQTYADPFYGVADIARGSGEPRLFASSPYTWDERKLRDRLFGLAEPVYRTFLPTRQFKRKPGLTLGIVSRLTPIKQFPAMFKLLSPVISRYPQINLEIFGSGGYASVRDLKQALAPIKDQVRFWGQQSNVAEIYEMLDYLLTGLPEREALGLNVIEAQTCGTPVIAVNAPPFTETVLDKQTGYLFRDPREDKGMDFDRMISALLDGSLPRPNPLAATNHLARFTLPTFTARISAALNYAIDTAP